MLKLSGMRQCIIEKIFPISAFHFVRWSKSWVTPYHVQVIKSWSILSKVRDGTLVALKFFRPGSTYEGAVQRERYILDTFVQVGFTLTHPRKGCKNNAFVPIFLCIMPDRIRPTRTFQWNWLIIVIIH